MALEKIVALTKRHIVQSSAIATVYSPAYAIMELTWGNMSHEASINAKYLGIATAFLGLGNLIAYGRDKSEKVFKITEKSQKVHDAIYLGSIGFISNPLFYLAAGSRDPQELLKVTIGGVVLGAIAGVPMGYAIDWFRDLSGVEESQKKMPQCFKKASPRYKKVIAASLIAASVGLTTLIYHVIPEKKKPTIIQKAKPTPAKPF